MENTLSVEHFDCPRESQNVDSFDISGNELLSILSMYDLCGLWRLDLKTSKVFWSKDVASIHNMEEQKDPVDLQTALGSYHPEDRKTLARLLDETIVNKTGYRFVLRMRRKDGSYKLVKCIGKYRVAKNGNEELI